MKPTKVNNASGVLKDVEWIKAKNLSILFAESQRPLNKAHVVRIANNFDPDMFGVVAVTKADEKGMHHIIDGQHRKAAVCYNWGDEELIPCQVFDTTDPVRAAKIFNQINSCRRAMSQIETFHVRVTANEAIECAVKKITDDCDYIVSAHGEKRVSCPAALIEVYNTHGGEILHNVLTILRAIWGVDPTGCHAYFIKGFAKFLAEFPHVNVRKLIEAVGSRYTPARLDGVIKSTKEVNKMSSTKATRDILFTCYNSAARGRDKLSFVPKKKKAA